MIKDPVKHIARILRTDESSFSAFIKEMRALTGKKDVLERLEETNRKMITETLSVLGLKGEPGAREISWKLLEKLSGASEKFFNVCEEPDLKKPETAKTFLDLARRYGPKEKGFYLKQEVARRMIIQNPPPDILKATGYRSVQELLDKEHIEEIFASLRFIESREWMNEVFLPSYKSLKAEDFEERQTRLLILPEKWLKIAQKFIQKKYHNVSHLKELGVIFIIPLPADTPGEIFRNFALLLHYMNEVLFYSRIGRRYAAGENFTANYISMLRGDVPENIPHDHNWLIVQRYLAKDDENDSRLFVPHVNPEAIHWEKAEASIYQMARDLSEVDLGIWELWHKLDFVGDFFPLDGKEESLVSFDLIDNIMSLVKGEVMVKYLYHHQEALWNEIYRGFLEDKFPLEEAIAKNLEKGYISVANV